MKTTDRVPVTDLEIKKVFEGTSFGSEKHEDTIKWSLLKIASGYATGYTAKCILQELKLLSRAKHSSLTKRGQYCLFEYFRSGYGERGVCNKKLKICACSCPDPEGCKYITGTDKLECSFKNGKT